MPSWPSALVERLLAWADALQQRHGVLGFPYAVVKKYGDDAGGRQAALITYYGFLSIFPLLLVAVSVLSLGARQPTRTAPRDGGGAGSTALQETVNHRADRDADVRAPLAVGIIGLLFSATGVVLSAYETLNHVAAVPLRSRFGFVARYARILLMLIIVLTGGLLVAALTVAAGALPASVSCNASQRGRRPRWWSSSSSSPRRESSWPDRCRGAAPGWPRSPVRWPSRSCSRSGLGCWPSS